ncbi:MAG: phosphomannomutase/phosphoglucomutase [Actinomycetia bacterium]|nr:phosphomannomutase/phosphoglucomutase [Actinomycetes bacterium]MCH9800669.1 phosphomannomutase/phosphoglucomutase [Actinomycetes bacterium]
MRDLSSVIKAYDVRGVVPDQLDADLAADIGAAFVSVVAAASSAGGPGAVVVGRDMRPSGPDLVAGFAAGVLRQGCDVIDIGLCSTDGLYFASGRLGLPAAMFTASHNPAEYNGIKLCRVGAAPVGEETGLAEIRDLVSTGNLPQPAAEAGQLRQRDMLIDYAAFLRSLVDLNGIRPLRVVVDAGNGMGGYTVPRVLGNEADLPPIPVTLSPMYFELDGTFPNHEANPIDPANMRDLQNRVRQVGADIGLAFDGDADRCFVVDERGELVSPSAITSMIAKQILAEEPGATIIHNLITSRAVPETILANHGVPVRSRVGHSYIKALMAETGAAFGGEHSGHFYFRDFWRADSGMLAALHVLALLGSSGQPMSELVARYERYPSSGEINSHVDDVPAAMQALRAEFSGRAEIDELDGLTFSGGEWWFNVRPSNTEPLLRLNAEASDEEELEEITGAVIDLIREGSSG